MTTSATSTKSAWLAATRRNPCPVCEGRDNCKIAGDGSAVWCGRIAEGSVRDNAGGQHLFLLGERTSVPAWRPPKRMPTAPKNTKKMEAIAAAAFNDPLAEVARQKLAEHLGVDAEALRRLGVGWSPKERAWTFPERDADGNVIGITTRFADGKKRRMAGGECGLFFDRREWMHSEIEPDYVLLPEGPSDVAALLSLGLAAIGRPSNLGGVELLGELLRDVSVDRTIVVVGEFDRKPHESLSPVVKKWHKPECDGCSACWPGKFGAVTTATKLAEILERPIAWAFFPDGSKDARSWLNSQPKCETSG